MSTRSTIVYGGTFHLYNEMFDEQFIYLEMDGTHYEAGYNRVMVPIPIHIWEVIRKRGAPDLSFVGKTDAELLTLAEQRIDARIADYSQYQGETGFKAYLFHQIDAPRDKLIADEVERYHERRKFQEEIQAEIDTLEAKLKPPVRPPRTEV